MPFKPAISDILCGASIAAVAVGLEAAGAVSLTQATGFCVSCHASDLVAWLVGLVKLSGRIPPPASGAPLLTTLGLFGGGLLAAKLAGEYRPRKARGGWQQVLAGALAANLALVALGCPTRQLLRLGYGDWTVLPALLGFLLGGALGTLIIKWRAQRV
jgi:hypothetical protein